MKTIAVMFCAYFNKLSHERAARFLTAAVLLLGGCVVPSTTEPTASKRTGEIHMTATLLIPQVQQKLAINVGLYESPKFLNYQQPLRATGTSVEYLPLGRASAQLFDQASRTLFTTVTSVNARPPLEQGLSVDGVIEPHIEAFEITDLRALGGGSVVLWEMGDDRIDPFLARIRYRFDLYDRGGAQVSSWVVIGDAAMLIPPGRRIDFFAILVDGALQDAMRTFVQDFGRNPDVMQWLNSKTR
jgi:hypothetical protein